MTVCPRCGTQNPAQALACSLCGLAFTKPPLGSPVPNAAAPADFSKTLMGQGPLELTPAPAGASQGAPPAAPKSNFGSTMVMASPPGAGEPPPAPGPAPAAANARARTQTVMGLAPPPVQVEQRPAPLNQTMPLVAPPAVSQAPAAATPGGAEKPPVSLNPATKTILGVARPGIAPLNPGVAKAAPVVIENYPSPPPPPVQAPLPALTPIDSLAPRDTRRAPVLAGIALGGALVLLATAAAAFFLLKGPGPIEAKALLDSQGREQLELHCGGCKDGDQIRLNQTVAPFRSGRAVVALPGGLKIGETRFEFALLRNGARKETRVTLSVPLEYRVRADEAGLNDPEPHLTVRVEAVPGTQVSVDGQALNLVSGKASYELSVKKELSGLEPTVKKLERRIPYRITPPGSSGETGEVTFQTGITPLTVQAPGDTITIDTATFLLAGRTSKGAALSISGRAIPVEPDGRFSQNLAISAVGESNVTLRASAPEHAPRMYTFRVRRVASLAEEARALRATATQSYANIAGNIEGSRGTPVALDGSVSEIGGDEYSTLLLLDTKSGCRAAPCLTKVVHGARLPLKTGDHVSVFGKVRGAVDGPRGSKLPEVFADFVLKGSR
ncbi:MAG: hypothetical protein ACOY0T_23725 [Myxococcota bacterium]